MLTEGQRLTERIKNHDPTIHYLQATHFKYNDTGNLKINGRESYIIQT